jgi:HemY protein
MYGIVEADDATKQLKRAEKWLQQHGEDPDLLLAAARLCLRNELWGKARSYLETVIALRPTPEAYQELGRLFMHLGDDEAAAEAFRNGLFLVSGSTIPAVPLLESDVGTAAESIRIEDQGDGD